MSVGDVQVVELWAPTADCCICECETRLGYYVGYCCGPTTDPIGAQSTEYPDLEVAGMPVCRQCHDAFYADAPAERIPT